MAASIGYVGGHLQYGVNFCKGHSYKQAVRVPGATLNGCLQRELSWSCGMSKFLQIRRCSLFQSPTNEKFKPFRTFTTLAYLRDGSTKYFDFAVIGSGVAGLRYALEVAKHGSVAVITKAEPHESNTNYAQGGVSAVLCPSDSIESHMQDTIVAGAYLCDEETVKVATGDGMAMAHRAQAVISNMECHFSELEFEDGNGGAVEAGLRTWDLGFGLCTTMESNAQEAANMWVWDRILDGSLCDPPVSIQDACHHQINMS
ncbi:hypothetical protein V6N11_023187 [Hibiscus sabdariffa]|uniref:FAD-dependent oxidoreductase 2 FAD-binding domain-containing protein n=1 Tax=Hibiscus sabdariffa TaxID=183260 RepID=A0ABR2TLI6_9ROSI